MSTSLRHCTGRSTTGSATTTPRQTCGSLGATMRAPPQALLARANRPTNSLHSFFTRRRWVVIFKITLPLLIPYVVSALRIAYGVGWKIALVAELFGTESGLGFLLQQAQSIADAATVFATCLSIVIVFWLGEKAIIDPLSRKFTPIASG